MADANVQCVADARGMLSGVFDIARCHALAFTVCVSFAGVAAPADDAAWIEDQR